MRRASPPVHPLIHRSTARSLATLYHESRGANLDDGRVERARELVIKVWALWGESRRERWRAAIASSWAKGGGVVTPLRLWLVRAEVEEGGGAMVWKSAVGMIGGGRGEDAKDSTKGTEQGSDGRDGNLEMADGHSATHRKVLAMVKARANEAESAEEKTSIEQGQRVSPSAALPPCPKRPREPVYFKKQISKVINTLSDNMPKLSSRHVSSTTQQSDPEPTRRVNEANKQDLHPRRGAASLNKSKSAPLRPSAAQYRTGELTRKRKSGNDLPSIKSSVSRPAAVASMEDEVYIDFLSSMELLVGDARSLRASKRGPFADWLWRFVLASVKEHQAAVVRRVTVSALARLLLLLYLDCFDLAMICDDKDLVEKFYASRGKGLVVQEMAEEVFWKFGGNASPDGLGKHDFKPLASTIEAAYVESGLVKPSLGLLELGRPCGTDMLQARSVLTGRRYAVKSIPRSDKCTNHPIRALNSNSKAWTMFHRLLNVHKHDNISRLIAVRVSDRSIHFIGELAELGSLAHIVEAARIEKFSRHIGVKPANKAKDDTFIRDDRSSKFFSRLRRRGHSPLPEEIIRQLFTQLMSAVAACHAKGIAHCNINLHNMLLASDGTLRLTNFDSTKYFCDEAELTKPLSSGDKIPHILYRSPEQVSGSPYSLAKADVWACGISLYFLLVGRPPFEGKNEAQLERAILRGRFHVPTSVSQSARSLLAKMLQVDPKNRLAAMQVLFHPWIQSINKEKKLAGTLYMNELASASSDLGSVLSNILNSHLKTMGVIGDYQFARVAKCTLESLLARCGVQSVCRRGSAACLWEYDCIVPSIDIAFCLRLVGLEESAFSGKLNLSVGRWRGPYALFVRRILLVAKAWLASLPRVTPRDAKRSMRFHSFDLLTGSRRNLPQVSLRRSRFRFG